MIKNIRHTGIVVEDMAASLNFYLSLGFRILKETNEAINFISFISDKENISLKTIKLITPNWEMIELLDYRSDKIKVNTSMFKTGLAHIAFTVENLDDVFDKLLKRGVSFNSIPQISPDKKAKVVFCKAPEGTYIELVEELS